MIRRFLCRLGFHHYAEMTATRISTPTAIYRGSYGECAHCGHLNHPKSQSG
jgi:hypothetical protein